MTATGIEARYRGRRMSVDAAIQRAILDLRHFRAVRLPAAARRALQEYLNFVRDDVLRRTSAAWPSGTGGNSLSSRSGTAKRSIAESVQVTGRDLHTLRGMIGGIWYLKTHENGATIRPKRSQYLTVPLSAALNPNGTPKKRSAREWSNTFVQRSKKGNLLIFQKQGRRILPLYVLKKQIDIPRRLGMWDSLNKNADKFIKLMEDMVVKEFQGV